MPAEQIVTVRMPASLVEALKARIAPDHYSDLSEQVRSIVRKGCLHYVNPVTSEIKELKTQLKAELMQESGDDRAKALIDELKNLLKGGDAS
ncbi:hypothetical protein GOV07_05325 [Candidatus Woesearchaeota archaeon]|nr:hypothetical protein [Candidatus Woesearchaeota archaeon]